MLKNRSVLIIEDEPLLNTLLQEYMEFYFETIYTAFDGENGWNLYNKHKPDLIITDIYMPKLNGLTLIENIRETDQSTQIVILSAHDEEGKKQAAKKLNLVEYLVKPVKGEELIQVMNRIKIKLEKEL